MLRDPVQDILFFRKTIISQTPAFLPDESGDHEVPFEKIGLSREGRPLWGFRCGSGNISLSLMAGAHADEPVGPKMLRYLVSYLHKLPVDHPYKTDFSWAIVMHANPDGAYRNKVWYEEEDTAYDFSLYTKQVIRELPGDDIEFGFPRNTDDHKARPENKALSQWWRRFNKPFHLHVSLHGMGKARGPWYLLERNWVERSAQLQEDCRGMTKALGYELHDMQRNGDKGFTRIATGFCTRPDSVSMATYFYERGDSEMAQKFRPSSMETVREISEVYGVDTLTLVSEMPLFITPHLKPMPLNDQMTLQWGFITAGIRSVEVCSK